MWIFTSNGFLSIVQHRELKDSFLIRARAEKHLQPLFPDEKIIENNKADYRYRVIVKKDKAVDVIGKLISQIDYDNFKNSIREQYYHDACFSVWSVMHDYQQSK